MWPPIEAGSPKIVWGLPVVVWCILLGCLLLVVLILLALLLCFWLVPRRRKLLSPTRFARPSAGSAVNPEVTSNRAFGQRHWHCAYLTPFFPRSGATFVGRGQVVEGLQLHDVEGIAASAGAAAVQCSAAAAALGVRLPLFGARQRSADALDRLQYDALDIR